MYNINKKAGEIICVKLRISTEPEHMKDINRKEFNRVSKSQSFAKKWIEKFNPQIKSIIY